jgi:hypothetical protein
MDLLKNSRGHVVVLGGGTANAELPPIAAIMQIATATNQNELFMVSVCFQEVGT